MNRVNPASYRQILGGGDKQSQLEMNLPPRICKAKGNEEASLEKRVDKPVQTSQVYSKGKLPMKTHEQSWIPQLQLSSSTGTNTCTICPRSSDPFYMVSYYIKWSLLLEHTVY